MHRERIVSGSASGNALSRSNSESFGGSSSVLRNAFAASVLKPVGVGNDRYFAPWLFAARICSACSSSRICAVEDAPRFRFGPGNENLASFGEKTSLAGCAINQTRQLRCEHFLAAARSSGDQIRMRKPVLFIGASQKFQCSRTREGHFKDAISLPAQKNEKKAFPKSVFRSRRRRPSHRS